MAIAAKQFYTPEQYLAMESNSYQRFFANSNG